MKPDNKKIYNQAWVDWVDMKKFGPASRWLRFLVSKHIATLNKRGDVKTVLDVGCGEGTITNMLADKLTGVQVIGCDFSKVGIECAKNQYLKKNLAFYHDEKSENLKSSYDLITAFEVLEHIDDWKAFLNDISKSSKKYLMLSFPTGRMRPFEVNVGHFRNYKKGEVEKYLSTRGFKVVKVFYAGFPFYNPLYREFCNLTNSGHTSFTSGKYKWHQKTIGYLIYILFAYFSSRNKFGNQFCGLFEKNF